MRPNALLLLLLLPLAASAAPAEPAGHGHQHGDPAVPAAAPATRWPAEPALRDGMQRIADAVAAAEAARTSDRWRDSDGAALAATVRRETNGIIANCHLPSDADQYLHGILATLLDASTHVERGHVMALAVMSEALADYRRAFDDSAAAR